MRKLFLAAYDVQDSKRLRTALALSRPFAVGGQKSVHECSLTPAERSELSTGMDFALDFDFDRFLLVRLDPRATAFLLGRAVRPDLNPLLYVH